MKKHGQWIGLFVLAQVVVFASLYWAHARAKPVPVVEKPKLIQVSPTALIGNEAELLGHRRAPYTLVEFGDYQCPPCAHRNEQVKRLLEEFPAELRFRFRHYPLEMHRYAMHSALISEISRARGQFWKVHDNLYALNTQVTPEQVSKMLNRLNVDEGNLAPGQMVLAKRRVQEDMKLADTIRVDATPTFLLCCPDGRVVKLGDLSQLENFIQ